MEDDTKMTEDFQEIVIDFGDICRFCLNPTDDSPISIHDKGFPDGREDTIHDFVTNFSAIEVSLSIPGS